MYAISASAPQRKLWIRRSFASLISNLRPIRRFGKNLLNCKRKHVHTNGTGPAHLSIPMKGQRLKKIIVLAFSFVLLYYSVAWAVLNCFDGEDEFHHGIVVSGVGLYDDHVNAFSSGHAHDFIDCNRPDYHVETLAASTSPTLLDRFSAEFRLVSIEFLGTRLVADESARGLGLDNTSQWQSSGHQLSDVPLYLSLAALRI
jgi:hypothetical protein